MLKAKYSVFKLFDTRKPLSLYNGGRQKRSCSCFSEITNHECQFNKMDYNQTNGESRLVIEEEILKDQILSENLVLNFNEESSAKENISLDQNNNKKGLDTKMDKVALFNETEEKMKEKVLFPLMENLDLSESYDNTSNSDTNSYRDESEKISSFIETSNSSWNNLSLINNDEVEINNLSNSKNRTRNVFPNVLNYKELNTKHSKPIYHPFLKNMNISRDRYDVIIPIRNNVISDFTRSQIEKCNNTQASESSLDCDIEYDKNNASLFECAPLLNSENSNKSININIKTEKNIVNSRNLDNLANKNVILYAYVSDIKGIEESLVLNKDRRFLKILNRYNCTAKILQMNNLTRGFPHTLLKIEAQTKVHLNCMARDTDRAYSNWNLRSQLRRIHIN